MTEHFITDHHNNVLPKRWELRVNNGGDKNNILVLHIDQHSDMATPPSRIDLSKFHDENYITDYAIKTCNIGNFIKPALQAGIIQQCIQLRTETSLLEFNLSDLGSPDSYLLILDIDIDFRAPEMVNEHMEKTFQKTKDLISLADLVTIATSPGFIDQDLAHSYVQKILS